MASADPDIARAAATVAANAAIKRLDAEGRRQRTAVARSTRLEQYLTDVDPDGTMDEEDRILAAKAALAEDMARLSLVAAQVRKERAAERRRAKQLAKAS